jgi:glycosyltransferase involved in cell wall biosynthesis
VSALKVLRVYHAGGDPAHRARERALLAAGLDVTLVVPQAWPGSDLGFDDVPSRSLRITRSGDVNRHGYADPAHLRQVLDDVAPDVLDIHEEPVSEAARQWLAAARGIPTVMYSAQNLDKRFPPPFAQYERAALSRVSGFYPCSAQAAAVLRGKGYRGRLRVLPLGIDSGLHHAGAQDHTADEVVLGLVGRLVPEKGVNDAVRVLHAVHQVRPARLLVVGDGPAQAAARALSRELQVADRCDWRPWTTAAGLSDAYRQMHVVLVPSRSTTRWVEQFGRVITEGRANGAVVAGYASGSIPEVVGTAGVVVREGDAEALAAAAVRLATERSEWERLRAAGLAATEAMQWPSVAAAQEQLYRDALLTPALPAARPSAATRAQARAEFGAPAATPVGARPFALPVLRKPSALQRALEGTVDALTRQR